jgi:hypothetical protein
MFAQLAERYRRGKAWRAKTASVNVLSGAPFGYRYVRKTPESGARYEVVPHGAVLVSEMFRRYADEGAAIADLRRWLTDQGVRTRTGKECWDRSVILFPVRKTRGSSTSEMGTYSSCRFPFLMSPRELVSRTEANGPEIWPQVVQVSCPAAQVLGTWIPDQEPTSH